MGRRNEEDQSHPSHPHPEGWGSLIVAGVEMEGRCQRGFWVEEWRHIQGDTGFRLCRVTGFGDDGYTCFIFYDPVTSFPGWTQENLPATRPCPCLIPGELGSGLCELSLPGQPFHMPFIPHPLLAGLSYSPVFFTLRHYHIHCPSCLPWHAISVVYSVLHLHSTFDSPSSLWHPLNGLPLL